MRCVLGLQSAEGLWRPHSGGCWKKPSVPSSCGLLTCPRASNGKDRDRDGERRGGRKGDRSDLCVK